jgi:ribose 5-phosphate isomerase A
VPQDELKRIAAYKAVEYVKSGMVLGLGTGSTANFAVARIGQLLKEGKLKDIIAVATSTVNNSTSQHLEFVDFYGFSDCSFLLG